jgi:hypothetical protein
MASFNKFNVFVENVAEKVHNLGADTLKVMLTNTAPVAADEVLADLVDLSTANGYTAGGSQATQTSSSQTSGTYKLVCADVTFTASGGSIGPFRYAAIYNDTPTSPADPLIGWWDYGTGVTITDGNSFLVDLSAANGVLQLV